MINKKYGGYDGTDWEIPAANNNGYVKKGSQVLGFTTPGTLGTVVNLEARKQPEVETQKWKIKSEADGWFTLVNNQYYLHADLKKKMMLGSLLYIPIPDFEAATKSRSIKSRAYRVGHMFSPAFTSLKVQRSG